MLDEEGLELRTTRIYSADVGQVLAKAVGPRAVYSFKGDELYVRAVVTSEEPPDNPAYEGQFKQAWTQPFGWEKHARQEPAAKLDGVR